MFLSYIVPLSILLPITIGVIKYKMAAKGPRLLLFYLVISGLINLSALVFVKLGMRNLPLLHLYTIVEAIFIFAYFKNIFVDQRIKKALTYLMIIFPMLCVVNFVFIQSIYSFNTYTRPLEAILITFFCLLYLDKSEFTENWINKPDNWLNMGILMYFPVACIIFILSNYLVFVSANKSMNSAVWNLHATLVLIMYLFWAKGFSLINKNG